MPSGEETNKERLVEWLAFRRLKIFMIIIKGRQRDAEMPGDNREGLPFLARLLHAQVSQPRTQVGVVKGKRLVTPSNV